MTCPHCGQNNPEDFVECEHCGELLVELFASERPEDPSPAERSAPPRSAEVETPFPALHTGVFPRHALFGNRYEILELIGEGGMGRVYRARDCELDKVIALKTIRGEKGGDPAVVQRFKQELLLARQITHKNVVRIYDLGEADGIKFFTMELIEGRSLKQLIRERGKLPVPEALALARRMAGALLEAHRQGVVHRDLKPQNIMVDQEGEPHIMDFGIARSAESSSLTSTGAVLGTPDYISPEQVRGENTDARSDLFSFGVILYEMLTGELPYQADTPIAKLMMRLTQKPRPPRELEPDLPRYLESLILTCLEADRELRYESAAAVLEDLEREQVDRTLVRRIRRRLGRSRRGFAAAALALAAGAGLAAYLDRGLSSPRETAETPALTLAILPFTNATRSGELDWMSTGIPEMLITDISQSRYIRPVPGERIVKLLRELGVEAQSRFDEPTLEAISTRAPAESVLYGQFVQSGDELRLDLSLRKAGSGVPIPIKVQQNAERVFDLVDLLTQEIKKRLDLAPGALREDQDRPIAEVSTDSLDALRAYQAGLALIRRGSNQKAIPLLQEAAARDPGFAMAHGRLAEAYLALGRQSEAEEAMANARALQQTENLPLPERYTIHAVGALVDEDFETAARSYQELARLYPEDPDIQLSLARSLEGRGHAAEALAAYERVLALEPGYGAALLGLGRTQVVSGRSAEAIRTLHAALESGEFEAEADPEALGMIHSILGVAYRETGDFEAAMEHFGSSLEHRREAGDDRGVATTLTNLAAVYEHRGQIEEALAAEREAVEISRAIGDRAGESSALLNMGLTLKAAGRLDEALESIRASMRIEMERQDKANLANRLDNIAEVYQIQGLYDDAMIYLEQARTHLVQSGDQQEQAINLHHIGSVRKAQGQYEKAIESFLAALPIFQEIGQSLGVATVQLELAAIYLAQGRYADAYRGFQQTVETYRKLGVHGRLEAETYLAHYLLDVGAWDDAAETLRRVESDGREIGVKRPSPLVHIGWGRWRQARREYRDALAHFRAAREEGERRGERALSLQARIAVGALERETGKLSAAAASLEQAAEEAARSQLRALEAQAAAALAEVYLDQEALDAAEERIRLAIDRAAQFSGRPILSRAYRILSSILQRRGQAREAVEAGEAADATLRWMLDNLPPEHVASFSKLPGVDASRAGAPDPPESTER